MSKTHQIVSVEIDILSSYLLRFILFKTIDLYISLLT